MAKGNKNESSKVKPANASTFPDTGKFFMNDFKETPSVVRYTPLPNSTEWFQNILQSKIASSRDGVLQIQSRRVSFDKQMIFKDYNTNQLSITIPETEKMSCNIPPPELSIASSSTSMMGHISSSNMDCSPIHESSNPLLSDDIEKNSICETASVASDLTRMCVSDEEDKVILVLKENDQN